MAVCSIQPDTVTFLALACLWNQSRRHSCRYPVCSGTFLVTIIVMVSQHRSCRFQRFHRGGCLLMCIFLLCLASVQTVHAMSMLVMHATVAMDDMAVPDPAHSRHLATTSTASSMSAETAMPCDNPGCMHSANCSGGCVVSGCFVTPGAPMAAQLLMELDRSEGVPEVFSRALIPSSRFHDPLYRPPKHSI